METAPSVFELGALLLGAVAAGWLARRFGLPAVIGYLALGVAVSPFTPGFVADREQLQLLADVGVVLLLFEVGIEVDLWRLRREHGQLAWAAPLQVLITTGLSAAIVMALGLEPVAAVVIGLAIALSSSVVIVNITRSRRRTTDHPTEVAMLGWSVVQDVTGVVLAAVVLATLDGEPGTFISSLLGLAAYAAVAIVTALALPRLLRRLREQPDLFLLTSVASGLALAGLGAIAFGVPLALAAFIGGLAITEDPVSREARRLLLPFRDLFAVLFFVSVGMLVDPASIAAQVGLVLVFVAVAAGLKGLLASVFAHLFGLPARSAILLGATLAQVGEFSFILAEEALGLGILAKPAYDVLLGTAVVSIILTPFAVRGADVLVARMEAGQIAAGGAGGAGDAGAADPVGGRGGGHGARAAYASDGRPHVVVLGAGRVGLLVTRAVRTRGFGCVVVDRDQRRLDEAARLGAQVVYGDAASSAILERVGLAEARLLVVALADPLAARLAGERALIISPRLAIAARARGARDRATLRGVGVRRVADPEVEAGVELARHALQRMGVSGPELAAIASGLRRSQYGPEPAPGGRGTGAPE